MSKIIHKHIVYMYTSWTKVQHCFFRTTVKPQSGLHRYLFKLCTSQRQNQNKTKLGRPHVTLWKPKLQVGLPYIFAFSEHVLVLFWEKAYIYTYTFREMLQCMCKGVCVWYKWCCKILVNQQLPETWKEIKNWHTWPKRRSWSVHFLVWS